LNAWIYEYPPVFRALIAFWSMQARHRPSKAAVAHSEVRVAVFVCICRYDIVAVKLQWPLLQIHITKKDNIIHNHSYLLST